MAVEKYVNNATTTLNGAIDNVQTSVVVTSSTGFPSSGNFRIQVESELMLVTAVAGTTWTVTRGAEATTAATHADTTALASVYTAQAIDAIRAEQIQRGTLSGRPAASRAGNLYLLTDGPYLCEDNGTAWANFGPLAVLTPVVQANFSWLNQGGATETAFGGAVVLQAEASRASPSVAARIKAPSAAPWTVTVCFVPQMKPTTAGGTVNAFCGLVAYESGTTKELNLGLFQNDTPDRVVSFSQSSGPTSSFSTVTNLIISIGRPVWFQLSNDGTNLIWRYSTNGFTWAQISTETLTTHFTTAPDRIGYCVNQDATGMTVYSWLES